MKAKQHIAVIGAGLMGHGIAQVFAAAGHTVAVYDQSYEALIALRERISRNLTDLGQDASAANRVFPFEDLGTCLAGVDVVIEAGPEDLAFKQKLFLQLELLAPRTALLASNTSVIPISRIVEGMRTPERAMGTHWWNPPYLVPLVEVIKAPSTDAEAAQRMFALLTALGKTPAMVQKDVAGFIGNRLQHALWREAIAIVEAGICSAETVDTVVKASFGRRLAVLGPLENADLIGTDLTLAIHRTVLPEIDSRPGPSPYLEGLVRGGRLGMKTGEGFHRWSPLAEADLRTRLRKHLVTMNGADEEAKRGRTDHTLEEKI